VTRIVCGVGKGSPFPLWGNLGGDTDAVHPSQKKTRILLLNGKFRCLLSGIIVDYRRLKTIERATLNCMQVPASQLTATLESMQGKSRLFV